MAYGGVADLSGKQIPNSTRFNLSSGAQYNFNVGGDNDAYVRAEYVYRSRYHSTLTSLVSDHPYYDQIPSRGVFNLRGGFDWGRYSVSAFVENVFEEDWYTGSNDNLSYSGRLITPHPRRVGIRIQTEFD